MECKREGEGAQEREGTDEGQCCDLQHKGDFYPLLFSAFAIDTDY